MTVEPASSIKEHLTKTRFGWTIIVFLMLTSLVSGLVIWQLWGTAPGQWCQLAAENATSCSPILLKLLDVKDHALTALFIILGLTVVSVLAIALGLKISAAGPGGTSVNVGAEETRVDTDEASVSIPTPPSGK